MEPIKISILGAMGRIGSMLIQEIEASKDYKLISAVDKKNINQKLTSSVIVTDKIEKLFLADVVIDFSLPNACMEMLDKAIKARFKGSIMVCSTGFTEDQISQMKKHSNNLKIARVSNTSLGMLLMDSLLPKIISSLPKDTEIEILEEHHRHKKDSPSGTSITLGETIAKARNSELQDIQRLGLERRENNQQIGFSSIRAANIIANHKVTFFFDDQILTLKHNTLDRLCFAKGALVIAKTLNKVKDKDNFFFNNKDIFNILKA